MFGLSTKAVTAIAVSLVVLGGTIAGVAMAGEDDFDAIYAPQWKAGYSYAYDVSGEVSYLYEGAGATGELEATEFGPFPISKEVLNTQYDLDGTPLYVSAATLPISNLLSGEFMFGEGLKAYPVAERKSDLAPIPVLPDWGCQSADCPSGGLQFVENNPLTYLNFPLTQGKRWEQTAEIPIPLEGDMAMFQDITKIHVVGEVGGMETLSLPVGDVEAVRVDFSYTPVGLQEMISYYREEIENTGVEVERLDIQLGLHEIVYYSPQYEAVVSDAWIVRALADIAIKGEVYGQNVDEEVYAEANFFVKADLTGASLVEKAELDPIQLLKKLSDKHTIVDAAGKKAVKAAETYTVGLTASSSRINAAEAESITFDISTSRADGIPPNHVFVFELLDGAQQMVESKELDAMAQSVEYEFADPGVYLASVRAYDSQGNIVSQATAAVEADYEIELDARCDEFLGVSTGYCYPEDVPVYAGAQQVIVEVQESGLMLPIFGHELYLELPDGERIHGDYYDTRIQVDDLDGLALGDWELVFRSSEPGVFEDVEFIITVDYGFPDSHDHGDHSHEGGGEGGRMSVLFDMLGGIDSILEGTSRGQPPASPFVDLI